MRSLAVPMLPLAALVLASCASAPPVPPADRSRPGRVEAVYETTRRTVGHPLAGRIAGALVGGVIGLAVSGPDRDGHHDSSGETAALGAHIGATIGEAASQGVDEERTYEVVVRFDDTTTAELRYKTLPPFRPGDRVLLSPGGLVPTQAPASAPQEPPVPPPPAP